MPAVAPVEYGQLARCWMSKQRRFSDGVQWRQRWRFTAMCVCMCAGRFDRSEKACWQSVETNVSSTVNVRSWSEERICVRMPCHRSGISTDVSDSTYVLARKGRFACHSALLAFPTTWEMPHNLHSGGWWHCFLTLVRIHSSQNGMYVSYLFGR